jgi:cytidine deaminase
MSKSVEAGVEALFAAAKAARARAYAPYSRFSVGAAIRAPSGAIYAGCNVENAAYPQGSCAEAGAIAAMALAGEQRIEAILVVGDGEGLCTPCGGCRQRIREFAGPATPIHIAGPEGVRARFTLAELLPHSFGPEHLGKNDAPAFPSPLEGETRGGGSR